MASSNVAGRTMEELVAYFQLTRQLGEIERQLRQKSGYRFNTEILSEALQAVIEGKFGPELRAYHSTPLNIPSPFESGQLEVVENLSPKFKSVHVARIGLKNGLRQNETFVRGSQRLARLDAETKVRLDAWFLREFWDNKELIPESWSKPVLGMRPSITFDGTVFRHTVTDERFIATLFWNDLEWEIIYRHLADEFRPWDLAAVIE